MPSGGGDCTGRRLLGPVKPFLGRHAKRSTTGPPINVHASAGSDRPRYPWPRRTFLCVTAAPNAGDGTFCQRRSIPSLEVELGSCEFANLVSCVIVSDDELDFA